MQITTGTICQIDRIKPERLREWIIRGYITPSIQKANGQGTRALFSSDDWKKVRNLTSLIDFGLSRECAARVINDKRAWRKLRELTERCRPEEYK